MALDSPTQAQRYRGPGAEIVLYHNCRPFEGEALNSVESFLLSWENARIVRQALDFVARRLSRLPRGIRVVISGSTGDVLLVEAREEFAQHWETACNNAQACLDYTP